MSRKLTRHQQRKAETHQKLLDAAREVIVEQGYNNVDILDITESANLSKATFYQHFPNKEECVRELIQQGFDALVHQILGPEQIVTVSPAWITETLETLLTWAHANRELLLIMVGGAASSQLNVFGRNYMVEVIERTVMDKFTQHDHTPRYSPTIQAQVITGILIQLMGWWLENDTGYSAADMGQMIHDIIQQGLGSFPTNDRT